MSGPVSHIWISTDAPRLRQPSRTRRPHRMKRLLSRSRMMFRPKPLTPFHEDPLLDHKAKSRKQQQAQNNSFEGRFVDPSEQDDTYSRSSSQGGQRNAKVD